MDCCRLISLHSIIIFAPMIVSNHSVSLYRYGTVYHMLPDTGKTRNWVYRIRVIVCLSYEKGVRGFIGVRVNRRVLGTGYGIS
jgi:hypothetical protein